MKIALLSLLTALGVAFVGAYEFENYQQFVTDTRAALARIDAIDSELKPQVSQVNDTVVKIKQTLAEMTQQEHWKVEQVKHAIYLAHEQLQISRDLNTTLRLLAAADNQLQSMPDPKFMLLRESLKQDQLALKAVKLPDQQGLWLTITALISKIPDLPARGLRFLESSASLGFKTSDQEDQTDSPSWKIALQKTLQEFKDLVKIQHHSKPIEPLLSEEQQLLARENLRLLLEQIRWSVLHGNTTVYETSIQNSMDWLNTYFETSDDRVKQLEIVLKELSAINIYPALPDMNHTLQLLSGLQGH